MTAYENASLFAQVHQSATIDELTGVANRRHFFAQANSAYAERRLDGPVSAIMLDIDHFKSINDTYGHMVGDEVIREVARRLSTATRDGELLGRFGGEEFALVLPAGPHVATQISERLRASIAETPVQTSAGPLAVTVSVGVTAAQPTDRQVEALLGRADAALYRAKAQGRNRVAAG